MFLHRYLFFLEHVEDLFVQAQVFEDSAFAHYIEELVVGYRPCGSEEGEGAKRCIHRNVTRGYAVPKLEGSETGDEVVREWDIEDLVLPVWAVDRQSFECRHGHGE